jgi:hypothetical protein
MAAEEDREEPHQVEQQGDHRAEMMAGSDRQINHFAADGVLAMDKIARALKRAKLPAFRLYDLRHTFASCSSPRASPSRT